MKKIILTRQTVFAIIILTLSITLLAVVAGIHIKDGAVPQTEHVNEGSEETESESGTDTDVADEIDDYASFSAEEQFDQIKSKQDTLLDSLDSNYEDYKNDPILYDEICLTRLLT